MGNKEVPVITYHSIGPRISKHRIFYGLRTSIKTFESHLEMLKKKNYTPILLDEFHNTSKLPKKPIVITFDDGYLDNWVYSYPLLKKYGFRASIFVSTDFVDPSKKVRPNLFDRWNGSIDKKDLCHQGFLSWKEMKIMENEGVMDIQSHAKTHTWYFCGDRIIDFLYPNSLYERGYEWIVWNSNPTLKPFYLNINLEDYISLGAPIYQHGKSLETKRYFPDKAIGEYLTKFVIERGGSDFFEKKEWRRELIEKVREVKKKENSGYFESNEKYLDRVRKELENSKKIIERKLNKEVNYLCWPGGSINETNLNIAGEVGYKATTISKRVNTKSKKFIKRVAAPALTIKSEDKIYDTIFLDGRYLNTKIKAYQGSISHRLSYYAKCFLLKKFYQLRTNKKEYYYIRR